MRDVDSGTEPREQAVDAHRRALPRAGRRAERLRARGKTGDPLNQTMAALENLRLAMLKLQAGIGSVDDLTRYLERARAIGEAVDRRLVAEREVDRILEGGDT